MADDLVKTRPEPVVSTTGRTRGLVSSRVSGARVDAGRLAPPEDLADIVECFWWGRWDLPDEQPHTTELLGDPCAHVVFEDGDNPGARVVGVWTRRWVRRLEGQGRVFGVKLHPGAAVALLPGSARDFTDELTPFDSVIGHDDAARLSRAVLGADSDERAFEAFGRWCRASRRRDNAADVSLAVALAKRVLEDRSITTVATLTSIAGVSERPLQRLFAEHVGASPKWVITRRRIQDATERLEAKTTLSLADLAAELGYTDQAHFSRDFRRLVGRSPKAWVAEVWR